MPTNNATPIPVGADMPFPQDGPTSGTTITRISSGTFNLAAIATYLVMLQVGVTEAGQFVLTLNGIELAHTVVGRATGTNQIVGTALITSTSINSVLSVRNPTGNSTALTVTPLAGGTHPVSAHLIVQRLN
jgi:hypothetical protein